MYVIISYDISDNERRNRLARMLKNYCRRMQYSVFEGDLSSEQISDLKAHIGKIISADDSVRLYQICEACKTKVFIKGSGRIYEDPDIYVI